jgi:hypothetical protein
MKNLEERQKREVEALTEEINHLNGLLQRNTSPQGFEELCYQIKEREQALMWVNLNPEEYFKNIDKEE